MELAEAGALKEIIAESIFTETQFARICNDVVSLLAKMLGRNIIHRDIKSDNVLGINSLKFFTFLAIFI